MSQELNELHGQIFTALNDFVRLQAEESGDSMLKDPVGECSLNFAVIAVLEDDENIGRRLIGFGREGGILEAATVDPEPSDDNKVAMVSNSTIGELTVMDMLKNLDDIDEHIAAGISLQQIAQIGVKLGMLDLIHD